MIFPFFSLGFFEDFTPLKLSPSWYRRAASPTQPPRSALEPQSAPPWTREAQLPSLAAKNLCLTGKSIGKTEKAMVFTICSAKGVSCESFHCQTNPWKNYKMGLTTCFLQILRRFFFVENHWKSTSQTTRQASAAPLSLKPRSAAEPAPCAMARGNPRGADLRFLDTLPNPHTNKTFLVVVSSICSCLWGEMSTNLAINLKPAVS